MTAGPSAFCRVAHWISQIMFWTGCVRSRSRGIQYWIEPIMNWIWTIQDRIPLKSLTFVSIHKAIYPVQGVNVAGGCAAVRRRAERL